MAPTDTLPVIDDIELISLPHFSDPNGSLSVIEASINVPFEILRVFFVAAPHGSLRGLHAHRRCSQFLTCLDNSIEVECDDGAQKATFRLDRPNVGLLIPHGIWALQTYLGNSATLCVVCDRRYEPDDYIRDYAKFLEFRREIAKAFE